jgi:hypothetical protein
MIGAEGAQSNSRHPRSGVKRSLRHRSWINLTGSLPIICLHAYLLDRVQPHLCRETSDVLGTILWQ